LFKSKVKSEKSKAYQKQVADTNFKMLSGVYSRSIVWDFFVDKKTKFTDLVEKDLH
jgi:hypothetical protein